MSKIYLAYGHGGSDPGAVKGARKEKDYNLKTGLAAAKYLRAAGHTVTEYRTSDTDHGISSSARVNNVVAKAKASGAAYFLDVHYNAGGGKGCECYYSVTGKGKDLAAAICKQLSALGLANRGAKTKKGSSGDYFGVIRQLQGSMQACLAECAFIDTAPDMELVDNVGTDAVGKAIAQALCNIAGGKVGASAGSGNTGTGTTNNEGGAASTTDEKAVTPFTVQVKDAALNVRKGPGTSYGINTVIKDKGVYTIIAANSAGTWGKLKSGAGWICITSAYVERVSAASPAVPASLNTGDTVVLRNAPLYASSSSEKKAGIKSGTFFIWDSSRQNGRIRITNNKASAGKTPAGTYVTGWVSVGDCH